MENNTNKYDDLDNLFRSRLTNESPSKSEWNVPPDSILEQVQNQLSKSNRKKRKTIFLWIFAALFFISLIGFQLHTSLKVDRLSQAINYDKKQIIESNIAEEKNVSEIKSRNSSDLETGISKSETHLAQEKSNLAGIGTMGGIELQSSKAKLNENSSEKNVSNLIKGERSSDGIMENTKIFNGNNDLLKDMVSISNAESQKNVIADSERLNYSFVKLPLLGIREFVYARDKEPVYFKVDESNEEHLLKRKFEGYVFSTLTMSSFRMTNIENNDFSLTKYDNNYLGYQLGAGLKINLIKNLQLNSSLSWSRLNNKSLFKDDMAYKLANESLNAQGEKMYDTNLNVESPMGSFSAEVRFGVADQQIEENDLLNNTTEINQHFNLINLSLGLDYTFLNSGKFQLLISSGLTGNYLYELNQEMDTKVVFTDKILMDNSFTSNNMDEIDPYFLSIYGNLGMRFNMSERLYFQLSGGWENALGALRTTKSASPSSTFLNHVKSQVHIAYRF
jgi:opacity protein-like surface antigen